MNARTARKVVRLWSLGLGRYTDNRFGTVLAAHRKLVSYHTRRHDHDALAALPGLPEPWSRPVWCHTCLERCPRQWGWLHSLASGLTKVKHLAALCGVHWDVAWGYYSVRP